MSSTEDERLWLAMALLGLRSGEAAALTWQDVDLGGGVLHVVQARKWTPQGYEMGPPKTRKAVRALKMPERLAAALARTEPGEPEALVWPGKEGRLHVSETSSTPELRCAKAFGCGSAGGSVQATPGMTPPA